MKFIFRILLALTFSTPLFAQNIDLNSEPFANSESMLSNDIAIIPEPVRLVKHTGHFVLPHIITIQVGKSPELKQTVAFLKERLSIPTGYDVNVVNPPVANPTIKLIINDEEDVTLGTEGYHLTVGTKQVVIRANKPAGLFYGVQSLVQLLPKEIESKEEIKNIKWIAPCVDVTDYPRLGWRGLMFDVARHFFTKAEVKQYIDAMVRYKYNILHLHLADDEGWRIEIKGLPKLTEVGAWNVKRVGTFGDFIPPKPDEPRNYGGFYTQEDIKELVAYAKDRFVDIMPEIDVPGHSLAAIASYPELSCTPDAVNYKVRSGKKLWIGAEGHHH